MTRLLEFTKMHGAGNDFVVLDGLAEELPPLEPLARRLADRRFGIGADQILVVRPSRAADFRMEIYNADGSPAEMCANGIRAFYRYLRDRGITSADAITVETLGGIVRPRWVGRNRVSVEMGRPVLEPGKIIMHSHAEKTVRALEKEGVEVITFDSSGIMQGGTNGIKCITMELLRDDGPRHHG